MSLTGNLEVFPIEEVLRLLARSRKTGCLRVDSAGQQGRIFIAGGAITFGTTGTDEEVRRQVINAGLVTEEDFRKVDLSGASLSDVLAPGVSTVALTDFVREQVVESLYRVRKAGAGKFDFLVDIASRYPTGQALDAEVAIGEADRRSVEWADIESVVPDMRTPYRLSRELPDENPVTINSPTWRFLAAVEAGASADDIAEKLGLSKFRAAREMASLVRAELLEEAPASIPTAPADAGWFVAPAEPVPVSAPEPEDAFEMPEVETPAAEPEPSEWMTPDTPTGWEIEREPQTEDQQDAVDEPTGWEPAAPARASHDETVDHDTSWFTQEPVTMSDDEDDEEEASEETVAAERTAGWWTGPKQDLTPTAEVVEEDEEEQEADAFLESVFSQLNEPAQAPDAPAEDDANFGLGLLRRRRMGAAARDITGQ